MAEKAVTNVINTKAAAIYSIRSSSKMFEKNLINEIEVIINNFINITIVKFNYSYI